MRATQILMDEHRVIERVLAALQLNTSHISAGTDGRPGFYLEAADFIRNFADGSHHHKEEGMLFIAMQAAGVPSQGGPIGVMLAEHEQGRAFTRAMKAGAEKWQAGDLAGKPEVIENANGYANLLRQHIYKEDNILFPMADKFIQPDDQLKLTRQFEGAVLEEQKYGIPQKYLALAESLEVESGRPS